MTPFLWWILQLLLHLTMSIVVAVPFTPNYVDSGLDHQSNITEVELNNFITPIGEPCHKLPEVFVNVPDELIFFGCF